MDADATNPSPGKPPRKRRAIFGSAGALAGIVKNPDRPAVFDILFWSILALIYAFHVFAPEVPIREIGLTPMTVVCAVLVAVGLALPWRPSAPRLRKLLSPAFLLAATAMLFASDLIWALGLYPIAFANGVFLFGLRRGAVYAATGLVALFVTAFLRSIYTTGDASPETVVQRWALILLLTLVCLGLSAAVIDARRSRGRAQQLP